MNNNQFKSLIFAKDIIIVMTKCACCGEEMMVDKETERLLTYKCQACGLSNTELKTFKK